MFVIFFRICLFCHPYSATIADGRVQKNVTLGPINMHACSELCLTLGQIGLSTCMTTCFRMSLARGPETIRFPNFRENSAKNVIQLQTTRSVDDVNYAYVLSFRR